ESDVDAVGTGEKPRYALGQANLFRGRPGRLAGITFRSKPMHEDLHSHKQSHSSGAGEAAQMVKDPDCGMNVEQSSSKHSAEFGGQKYYFCSPRCKSKFLEGPRRFLSAKHETPSHQVAHAEGRTIYTCPMHPEVRQTGPGSCPICGMAL